MEEEKKEITFENEEKEEEEEGFYFRLEMFECLLWGHVRAFSWVRHPACALLNVILQAKTMRASSSIVNKVELLKYISALKQPRGVGELKHQVRAIQFWVRQKSVFDKKQGYKLSYLIEMSAFLHENAYKMVYN